MILSESHIHYLKNVLKYQVEEQVLVFNRDHGEWVAEITTLDKRSGFLAPLRRVRPPLHGYAAGFPYRLEYAFAPLKKERLDYMVQKAVEMGADSLQPLLTDYTNVRSLSEARLRANAIEAAEQSGRLSVPLIETVRSLTEWLMIQNSSRLIIFCDEEAPPLYTLTQINTELRSVSYETLTILIGPEGGFSPEERAMLIAHPGVMRVSLGPHILRADTAAVAAFAILQFWLHFF